jgi:hypothetical protein
MAYPMTNPPGITTLTAIYRGGKVGNVHTGKSLPVIRGNGKSGNVNVSQKVRPRDGRSREDRGGRSEKIFRFAWKRRATSRRDFSPIKRKSNNQQITGEKVAAAGARWLLRFAKVFGA